jgi:general secretion pathway protein M
MTDSAKLWWQARTLREQRLLIAMFALLALVLVWLLVIRPVGDALSAARERHGAAVQAVAEARAQAELVRRLEKTVPPSLGGPIDAVIGRAASDAGFPIAGLQREGSNQATLISNSVRPQAFFAWVDQMEAGRGLIVERLSATANSDRTLSVQVTFRSRGG